MTTKISIGIVSAGLVFCASACSDNSGGKDDGGGVLDVGTMDEAGDEATDAGMCPEDGCLDNPTGTDDDTDAGGCSEGGTCNAIDLLFVIDNSGTMAAEQQNLANNFAGLIDRLANLKDSSGAPVTADMHIMITTTDMDHSMCTDLHPAGYTPAMGAPVTTPCTDRLGDFQTPVLDATTACTSVCQSPVTLANGDQYIKWNGNGTNINAGALEGSEAATAALECLGPQGINGCGYESPLESMMQALSPAAAWNQGSDPFLRKNSVLAVAVITDEADCSTMPAGQTYFWNDADTQFWPDDPQNGGTKTRATSATCWYAGVDCGTPDPSGVYAGCSSVENGVLHSTSGRYIEFLEQELDRDVVMLGILGVPEVTAHNPEAPFEPTAGGVFDLVYRQWQASDILPGDPDTPADKTFDFGIGPGCTNPATGQAIPPVRVKEVCESLNGADEVRCCIESICDDDFSAALQCLTGVIEQSIQVG